MSEEFERDLGHCKGELDAAREELLGVVTTLKDDHLDKGRRGGWAVRRVLEHVIWSEWLYSRLITHLRGQTAEGEIPPCAPSSAADSVQRLEGSRQALVDSFVDVDEESFYHLGTIGHEEYSILSILENEINHEREHAEQVQAIVNAPLEGQASA